MKMDPASIAITGLVIKTLELVHKRREGTLQKEEAQELYSRIFASLRWEIQQNMERCKGMIRMAETGSVSAGVLSFFVRDALFPDFCRMCPDPFTVAEINRLYSALERIHHWQRLTDSLESKHVKYIIGYADDLFNSSKKLHNTFNKLVDILRALAPDVKAPPTVKTPNQAYSAES
jgi:hypothetical protein